jgi:hypothetical protein
VERVVNRPRRVGATGDEIDVGAATYFAQLQCSQRVFSSLERCYFRRNAILGCRGYAGSGFRIAGDCFRPRRNASEFRLSPCSVPEMNYFHALAGFVNAVVDASQNRAAAMRLSRAMYSKISKKSSQASGETITLKTVWQVPRGVLPRVSLARH